MPSFSRETPPLLHIRNATLVRDGTIILENLNLRLDEGRHTAIVGANGSGKSSLIKLITRQHYPLAHDDGSPTVSVFGRHVWDVSQLRSLLGIVAPDLHAGFIGEGGITGREAVLSGFFASQGLIRSHVVTPTMEENARAALQIMEATELASRRLETLSTGEARRVLIARALVHRPRALILDEPTTGLDIIARRNFLECLRRVAQTGTTLILVTHHLEEILPEMRRLVMMKAGRIFRDGDVSTLLTDEIMTALFEAPVRVRHRDGYYSAEAVASA